MCLDIFLLLVACAVDGCLASSCQIRLRTVLLEIAELRRENSRLKDSCRLRSEGTRRLAGQETPSSVAPWVVSEGSCEMDEMDNMHCISSPNYPSDYTDNQTCEIGVALDWTGSLHVHDFDTKYDQDLLYVNGHPFSGKLERNEVVGLEGLVPKGVIHWSPSWTDRAHKGWKICHSPLDTSKPWAAQHWQCTSRGTNCLPTVSTTNYGIFNACTTVESDLEDLDDNGNLHNGYPWCTTETTSRELCGPCSCAAGEEQQLVSYTLSEHFAEVSYITCTQCPPGHFRNGVEDEGCSSCDIGHYTHAPGATACSPCPQGSTAVQVGRSACDECPPGHWTEFANVSACATCGVGRFQNATAQTFCHNCSEVLRPGGANMELWTTMSGDVELTRSVGASTVSSCGCEPGAWLNPTGDCMKCGEGMTCNGMGVVEVQAGFFAPLDNAGFIWRCHGDDSGRCPGGRPGTCARNRLNTSVACGTCTTGTRMTSAGPCETCTSTDVWWLVCAGLLLVLALACVYYAVATEDRAKQKQCSAFLIVLCSQVLTVFQMLGILDLLSVVWPTPFSKVLKVATLLNLRLDILNVGCVVSMSSLALYCMTAFGFVAFVCIMVVIHVSYEFAFHSQVFCQARFKELTLGLVGPFGTIFMSLFITISSTVFAPFHCDAHPNGERTVHEYQQTVCWNLAHGHEHLHMIVTGAFASLIPVGFVSVCIWVVVSLPKRLCAGDTMFLHSFAFLFFRFRPGTYWYVLVPLMRNLCVAIVPSLSEEGLQLFFFDDVLDALYTDLRIFLPLESVPGEPPRYRHE